MKNDEEWSRTIIGKTNTLVPPARSPHQHPSPSFLLSFPPFNNFTFSCLSSFNACFLLYIFIEALFFLLRVSFCIINYFLWGLDLSLCILLSLFSHLSSLSSSYYTFLHLLLYFTLLFVSSLFHVTILFLSISRSTFSKIPPFIPPLFLYPLVPSLPLLLFQQQPSPFLFLSCPLYDTPLTSSFLHCSSSSSFSC